jgi:hypothetical protein
MNGAMPINEHSNSTMLQHYWQATIGERTQIRRDAGYEDEELIDNRQQPSDDVDTIEREQEFNAEQASQTERERWENGGQPIQSEGQPVPPQEMPVNNGMPVIPVDLGEYIQSRDIISAQNMALNLLIPMLEAKLEPDAPEHTYIAAITEQIQRAKGSIYDENRIESG